MNSRMTALAISTSLIFLLVVIAMVRKRRFSEEYSFLWVVTAAVLLVLVLWPQLLTAVTRLVGAQEPGSAFFFFGIIFLVINVMYSSAKISAFQNDIRELTRALTLLKDEVQEAKADD